MLLEVLLLHQYQAVIPQHQLQQIVTLLAWVRMLGNMVGILSTLISGNNPVYI